MKRIINNKGLLNSFNDQPSLIDDEGNKYWHKDGRFRRDNNLPYVEMSNGEKHYKLENGGHKIIGTLDEKWFDKNSDYHREDGPALIWYYKNGNIRLEVYCSSKMKSKSTEYYENGNAKREEYYLNGVMRRKNGPSQVDYNEDNSLKSEFIINKKWSYCKI